MSQPSAEMRVTIFYVFGVMQYLRVYIFADFSSARNLNSKAMFKRLSNKPKLRPIGNVRVIGGQRRFSGDTKLCTATG